MLAAHDLEGIIQIKIIGRGYTFSCLLCKRTFLSQFSRPATPGVHIHD